MERSSRVFHGNLLLALLRHDRGKWEGRGSQSLDVTLVRFCTSPVGQILIQSSG